MGIGSSSNRYPSCTSQSNCLMTKMVMGAQWKCGIHNKCSNLAFSTPCSHFHGSNVITTPLVFCFIKFTISRCGNFSLSVRSQSLNFMVGTRLRCVPSIQYCRGGAGPGVNSLLHPYPLVLWSSLSMEGHTQAVLL